MNGLSSKIIALALAALAVVGAVAADPAMLDSNKARQLYDDGNYREALEAYRALTLDPAGADGPTMAKDVHLAITCLAQLNETALVDAYREKLAEVHAQHWQVLGALAQSYLDLEHQGVLVAGNFERGGHRGGGRVANTVDRDRARALQLFRQAMELAAGNAEARKSKETTALLDGFAQALLFANDYRQAWKLQTLTSLDELPDVAEGWGYWGDPARGAPVDEAGNPVVYDAPSGWQAAKNDGERWRFVLATRSAWAPDARFRELLDRAEFLDSQFGVQTMAEYGWWLGRFEAGDRDDSTKHEFALDTLGDDEAIAKLADGIKRFKLADEHNPVALWKQIVEEAPATDATRRAALERLAATFENRRQYSRAVEFLQLAIGMGGTEIAGYVERLTQITSNWGRFEPTATQPAGRGAQLQYRFRNGNRVEFVARPVELRKLLDDVKAYLKSSPEQLQWERTNIDNLGYRLVVDNQQKYLGPEAAKWALDLDPRPKHFDRRVDVTTPLQKAGAYLVTARMDGGNEHHIVVWVADAAIVKKPMAGKALYYVADAVTGKPLPKCNVEFFGYRQEQIENVPNRYRVTTKNFAEFTNESGLVELPVDANQQLNWLAIATTPGGGLAYLGFSGVWAAPYQEEEYHQVKVFTITDRPVYRPKHEVHYKFWVATAKYDQDDASAFAGQSFLVEIHDPKGEKVSSKSLVADSYGGLAGTWTVPANAALGQYSLQVVNHGGGSFRVEEYKKPEFEVTVDGPSEPVQLGEKITAKITAEYYFGSPVTEARVKYKVLRTRFDDRWFPPGPWDWLYGRGYWWFADDYVWYPGWGRWGCVRPWPWWFWRQPQQPEVVAESETTLNADGTVDVEIDTAPAKEFHPDEDHQYQIQVEVTDQSRRTIVADGRVLAARKPFEVCVWAHRGFYGAGDTIEVSGAARTLDGKPVKGSGVLRLLKIAYQDDKPVENEVARWDLPTSDDGLSTIQIKAAEAGQYRLAYAVTAPGKNDQDAVGASTVEGGQVLVIRGEGFDGGDFRFNDLEITPEQRDYMPGEKVRLQISANRAGAAVLLFLRPANGVYLPPQLVQLAGKSTLVEVDVTAKDMPNFFVEGVTVHSGRLHTVVREIFVPPVKRVVNVEVTPSAKEYLPGEHATVEFKLTNLEGKPIVGSTVVAIYDKALDYIAGGDAAGDIREFFWKWRRSHNEQSECSLTRQDYPVAKRNAREMRNIGVFGDSMADQDRGQDRFSFGLQFSEGRGGTMLGRGMLPESAAAAPMAAMEKSDQLNAFHDAAAPGGGAGTVTPTIRQNFADTALWAGAVETNAEGIGRVELDMPENLTAWKVNVWGMGRGTRVGQGAAEIVTRKNIIVRLQAPRFFVERDEVVLSAVVHNYLKEAKQVEVTLELDGRTLEGPSTMSETVEISAGGERRVDWRVRAVREGEATVRMSALTDVESDSMQMKFPVFVHGMLKTEAFSGAIRPADAKGGFEFVVPNERRPEQTRLEIRYSPTLAGAMLEAIPYLADYPYGCTEQTLNRFLPAVLAQRTLERIGVDLADLEKKLTNLNAQEIGDDVERAERWNRYERNPVYNRGELDAIVKASVNRLTEMQLADGGWGWFSGWGEQSSPHTTAVVVRGLVIAEQNGVALVPGMLERGVEWLGDYQIRQIAALNNFDRKAGKAINDDEPSKAKADDLDALVYLVLVEAQHGGATTSVSANADNDNQAARRATAQTRMCDYLYEDRTNLAVYSLATYGLALHLESRPLAPQGGPPANDAAPAQSPPPKAGSDARDAKLDMVLRNLGQYVRQDDENQTAWLDLPPGSWWHWYGSEYEAHAFYVKLLAATDPKSEVAPRMVKYLLNNRKHATYWNSTRDTALVVEAFADYLQATGEDKPNLTVDVVVDGEVKKTVTITPGDLFTFDNKLVLEGDAVAAGKHVVELRKRGQGPLYFNGYLTNFTLEDPIAATGLELKIERRYFKLTPAEKKAFVPGGRGEAVKQNVDKFNRTLIEDLAELTSGELVEVELVVESKNDYEYILFEDIKPAGFEAVDVRSGYTGNELGAYVEFHDERVALFARMLARGKHSVSYRLRAEIPGKFSALPTRVSAMYAPELKANSGETKLQVVD